MCIKIPKTKKIKIPNKFIQIQFEIFLMRPNLHPIQGLLSSIPLYSRQFPFFSVIIFSCISRAVITRSGTIIMYYNTKDDCLILLYTVDGT